MRSSTWPETTLDPAAEPGAGPKRYQPISRMSSGTAISPRSSTPTATTAASTSNEGSRIRAGGATSRATGAVVTASGGLVAAGLGGWPPGAAGDGAPHPATSTPARTPANTLAGVVG